MVSVKQVLKYLACPADGRELIINEKKLLCTNCKEEFQIIHDDTISLLPKSRYNLAPGDTRNEYLTWYSKLLKGNQYAIKKEKKNFLPLNLSRGFDLETISNIELFNNEIVCEVGSGKRSLSIDYAKQAKIVFHTDLDLSDIENARKKAKKLGISNIIFIFCNYFHLPFRKLSLPIMICTGNLGRHGLEHDKKLLEQVSTKACKNAKIYLDFVAKERKIVFYAKDGYSNFGISKKNLITKLEQFNLKIEEIHGIGYAPMMREFSPKTYKLINEIFKTILPPSRWFVKATKN